VNSAFVVALARKENHFVGWALPARMGGHTRALAPSDRSEVVAVEISEDLPLVLGGPGLLERAVATVVDNALRHAPRRRGGSAR
jgi:K+-sensing histidine kinase KdpD